MTPYHYRPLPRVPSHLAVLAGLTFACSTALAQMNSAVKASPANGPVFAVRGFDISGDNPLSLAEVERILAPYVRPDATLASLQQAATALEEVIKQRGFNLYRVVLPPQEVGGTIRLNLVRFVLDKVSIEGQHSISEANIRASLPELVEGQAPNFKTLAIQTAIANENPSKQIQVGIKESEAADRIDARIQVKEDKPWNFSVVLNNTGSDATGHDRVTLAGGHNNLFDRDHQFTAAYTTSLTNSSNVSQLGLNYRIPMYRQGGVIGLSYTKSDVLGDFGAFKSNGAGKTMGLNYYAYLPPEGGRRAYVGVGLEDKQFNVTEINGIPISGQQMRRSRPLTVSYNARREADTWVLSYNTELALNLSGGSGNDMTAYKSEDPRISTTRWKTLRAAASYSATLPHGWLWGLRGQFQFSPDALISGEQFGLGGIHSVRGTAERPISGDGGLSLSAELTAPELAQGWRLLGFIDAGWLSNHDPNAYKPGSDSLASVGLGLRYNSQKITLAVDYGHVITGSNVTFVPGSALPQRGDKKLHLSLIARF
ncbi:MAG: hypothetical protein RJB64_1605 [Pseudomonadota bacterium]